MGGVVSGEALARRSSDRNQTGKPNPTDVATAILCGSIPEGGFHAGVVARPRECACSLLLRRTEVFILHQQWALAPEEEKHRPTDLAFRAHPAPSGEPWLPSNATAGDCEQELGREDIFQVVEIAPS